MLPSINKLVEFVMGRCRQCSSTRLVFRPANIDLFFHATSARCDLCASWTLHDTRIDGKNVGDAVR